MIFRPLLRGSENSFLPSARSNRAREVRPRARAWIAVILVCIPVVARSAEVNLTPDAAFLKASRVLVGLGALPTFRNKELLIIKTDPVPLKEVASQADCGTMFGIPYTKDKRTKVAATYQVNIKPIGDSKSEVSVTVTLDGYMDVNEGAPFFIDKTRDKNKVLTCKSVGVLEAKFLEMLSAP